MLIQDSERGYGFTLTKNTNVDFYLSQCCIFITYIAEKIIIIVRLEFSLITPNIMHYLWPSLTWQKHTKPQKRLKRLQQYTIAYDLV